MRSASPDQERAFDTGAMPDPELVREGVFAVPMGLPTTLPGGAMPYSYAYVVDDFSGGLHVIDPGWDLPENIARWRAFLATIGRDFSAIATVTATHLHHDHIGLVAELTGRSGASFVFGEVEARAIEDAGDRRAYATATTDRLQDWGVPHERWDELLTNPPMFDYPAPDVRLADGELLPIPGRNLHALMTPGHTGGHLCLRDEDTDVLFTADHLLPVTYSGIGLGGPSQTTPIADFFASLDAVTAYDEYEALPGHEYRFRGIASRAATIRAHHSKRNQQVKAAMRPGATIWQIASAVTWSDGFGGLTGYRMGSALSQVQMHREFANH